MSAAAVPFTEFTIRVRDRMFAGWVVPTYVSTQEFGSFQFGSFQFGSFHLKGASSLGCREGMATADCEQRSLIAVANSMSSSALNSI